MNRPYLLNVVYYASDRPKGADKLIAWYRGQWRTITKFVAIEEAGLDHHSRAKAGWVTFEGMTKPRKMVSGTKLFIVHGTERVLRDISLGEFWFQPKGPKLPEVLDGDPYLKRTHGKIQV